jgi:para-nitrobenzyl esterase
MRKKILWLSLSCLMVLALLTWSCSGTQTDKQEEEEKVVEEKKPVPLADPIMTDAGLVSGEVLGDVGKEVRIYRGIPYAAPPIGELRWKPPQPVKSWTGVRECIEWADRAPQSAAGLGGVSEDCLHLNVMTPAKTTTDRLPVMVFFHGGGLTSMSGNSTTYCNIALPQHGVVTVTVNSRLGPIGYMAHPALTAESKNNASGNYGTLDLIASLEWVQHNIAAFGGDPDRVTIFGESGGGTKVLSCMSSPLAAGLFHRAIVESGSGSISPERSTTLEEAESMGVAVADVLGVSNEPDVLAALRAATWEEIMEAATESGYSTNLTVDGWVLPDSVYNVFLQGKQNNVPLIVGANEGEVTSFSSSVPMLASMMKSVSSKAYIYVFSHVPTGWREQGCVAFHGLELPYVFGHIPDGLLSPTVISLSATGGAKSTQAGPDAMDAVVAENTMRIWAQFAATGNPSVAGLVTWPTYEETTDKYLDIGYTLEVKTGVATAGVSPPEEEPAGLVAYTNAEYGFSLKYPGNWNEKTENLGPGVIWRAGSGVYLVPSVRIIIRNKSEGATLEEVFTAHLAEDGEKTMVSFTASDVNINGTDVTQAEVTYSSTTYEYESMIIGLVKDGKWIIIEVYTAYYPFEYEGQPAEILATVTFD